MTVREALYDSNVIAAYLFREEGRYEQASWVLNKHRSRAISIISIHEIHTLSLRNGVEDRFLRIKEDLVRLFGVLELTQGICLRASRLRMKFSIPEVDSLILATALEEGLRNFYTFDRDFKDLNGKRVDGTLIHYIDLGSSKK